MNRLRHFQRIGVGTLNRLKDEQIVIRLALSSDCSIRKIHTTNSFWFINTRICFSLDKLNKNEINKKHTDILPPLKPEEIKEIINKNLDHKSLKVTKENVKKAEDISETNKDIMKVEKKDNVVAKIVNVGKFIWAEIVHYFHGFRLLFLDMKVSFGILWSMRKGNPLTRRERKQLVRTVADIFRTVPFLIFIIVPFMEFLLPFYLKVFPFMLPSTFKNSEKEKEKHRNLLKGKIEIAKFLQDTIEESKSFENIESGINLETFKKFMKQVREAGVTASTRDIVKFSRLFKDEITLESLDHSTVKALCKLLDINSIGPKSLLLFHLRLRVRKLIADDKLIAKEGIDLLPDYELITLCRERGMRSTGVSKERLRFQLSQWLKLTLRDQVPVSLLLLSRTMYLPESLTAEEQLTKAILILPESAAREASLQTKHDDIDDYNKIKITMIKEESKAIKEEKILSKMEKERIEKERLEKERTAKEILVDKAPIIKDLADTEVNIKESMISAKDILEIENAIERIDSEEFGLQEDLEELKGHAQESTVKEVELSSKSQKHLENNLGKMINKIDYLLEGMKKKKENLVEEMRVEAKDDIEIMAVENKERKLIEITDLIASLKELRHKSASPGEKDWEKILKVLDEDHDGRIEVHHISELIDMLKGSGDMTLSAKEVTQLLDAIDKEEEIDMSVTDDVSGSKGAGGSN